jgi:hypothetical protein
MTTISNKAKDNPKMKGSIFAPLSGGNGVIVFQKNGVIRSYPLKKTKSGSTK